MAGIKTVKSGRNLWDARLKARRAAFKAEETLDYSYAPAGVKLKNGVWTYRTKKAKHLVKAGVGDVMRAAGKFKFKGLRIRHKKAKPRKAKKGRKGKRKAKGKKGKR